MREKRSFRHRLPGTCCYNARIVSDYRSAWNEYRRLRNRSFVLLFADVLVVGAVFVRANWFTFVVAFAWTIWSFNTSMGLTTWRCPRCENGLPPSGGTTRVSPHAAVSTGAYPNIARAILNRDSRKVRLIVAPTKRLLSRLHRHSLGPKSEFPVAPFTARLAGSSRPPHTD